MTPITVRVPIAAYREITISPGLKSLLEHVLFNGPSNRNLVAAIKAIRAETGWGLKESKDFVDNMTEEMLQGHRYQF